MSPSAWNHVSKFFAADEVLSGGFVRLKTCIKQMRKVNKLKMLKALCVAPCATCPPEAARLTAPLPTLVVVCLRAQAPG